MKITNHSDDTAGKIAWRGHVSRLVGKCNVSQQRGEYRARRTLRKAADRMVRSALRLALPAPPPVRYEMLRMPHRRVINS